MERTGADYNIFNDFCRERGRLNGLLPVEGATQAPVIAMLQMANNVRR